MKAAIAILVAATALPSPAAAFDVPSYDSEAYCRATTAIFGQNADFFRSSCMTMEGERRAQIGRLATQNVISDETVRQCDTLAKAGAGGSYQVFAGCLVMDLSQRILEGKLSVSAAK